VKNKGLWITVSVFLVLGLIIGCFSCKAPAPTAVGVKTLTIGATQYLTGPAAPWGIPGRRSLELWRDIVNEQGGFTVGGETYKVETICYDDKAEVGEGMIAVRKLILEDEVDIIIGPQGMPELSIAMNPLCTTEGVLHIVNDGSVGVLRPEWTECFVASIDTPDSLQATYLYVSEVHPEVKTVAIVGFDGFDDRLGMVYAHKGARDHGIEVVYYQTYPLETIDFFPLMTAVMETNPDFIDMCEGYPEFTAAMIQAAYELGFEGLIDLSTPDYDLLSAKVPDEFVYEHIMVHYFANHWDRPELGKACNDYYDRYVALYPEAGWIGSSQSCYPGGMMLEQGIEAADSVDPFEIAEALRNLTVIQHPLGEATWSGMELYGINQALQIPRPIFEGKGGEMAVGEIYYPPFPWDYDITGIPLSEEFIELMPK